MKLGKSVCLLVVAVAAATQWVGCSSEVVASESRELQSVWHGYHAQVRLVVYDDLNPNMNRRKFAVRQDVAEADEAFKQRLHALAPVQAPLSCAEGEKVYVLEIVEAGQKRRYSSTNNACQASAAYAGYVPTEVLAQLSEVMAAQTRTR